MTETEHSISCQFTCGPYAHEDEAAADFDIRVGAMQSFVTQKELRGEYIQGFVGQERADDEESDKRPRMDRMLIPNGRLLNAGWTLGPIGVELKASNVKLGRVIAQLLDYRRALFPSRHGSWISPLWWFVFPCDTVYGDIASIMAQNRIGFCCPSGSGLSFGTGGQWLIRGGDSEALYAKSPCIGRKRGSR